MALRCDARHRSRLSTPSQSPREGAGAARISFLVRLGAKTGFPAPRAEGRGGGIEVGDDVDMTGAMRTGQGRSRRPVAGHRLQLRRQALSGAGGRHARLGADRQRRPSDGPLVQVPSAARGRCRSGSEEPNALVAVDAGKGRVTPNLRATQVEIYEGLKARSQNAWPSLRASTRWRSTARCRGSSRPASTTRPSSARAAPGSMSTSR